MTDQHNLTDILQDKDQILMAAWTLPNTGELTDQERCLAMNNFIEYIDRNNIQPKDVAKQLGKPGNTTIRELMDRKWRENADKYIRTLNARIEQHARAKAASIDEEYVETRVAKAILAAARLVHENRTMGLLLAPSGVGKSRCAQAINHNYVGSVYVRIIDSYHHPRGLAHAISLKLDLLGTTVAGHRSMTRIERIMDRLLDSDRMLIIDEAQKLNDSALEFLRDIHDTTGVPVLLFATADLHDRLVATIGPDHGQLYSRYDVIHHLTEGKDVYTGGKPLFSVEEIRKLYDRTPIKLSIDAVKYLQDVANRIGEGSLRRCKSLLKNAARKARKKQGLSDGDKVKITAHDLVWVESKLRPTHTDQDRVNLRRQTSARTAATGT